MSNDTAKIQVNIKTGAGHDASLINIYADHGAELDDLLDVVYERIPRILSVQQGLQGVGAVAAAVGFAAPAEQPAQPSAAPPNVVPFPGAAQAHAPAGPEVITDKYGARWTYGLADAPALPDGRGTYIRRDWTSAKGNALKAWVDPAIKGAPRSFPAGATEAELIWIK